MNEGHDDFSSNQSQQNCACFKPCRFTVFHVLMKPLMKNNNKLHDPQSFVQGHLASSTHAQDILDLCFQSCHRLLQFPPISSQQCDHVTSATFVNCDTCPKG